MNIAHASVFVFEVCFLRLPSFNTSFTVCFIAQGMLFFSWVYTMSVSRDVMVYAAGVVQPDAVVRRRDVIHVCTRRRFLPAFQRHGHRRTARKQRAE